MLPRSIATLRQNAKLWSIAWWCRVTPRPPATAIQWSRLKAVQQADAGSGETGKTKIVPLRRRLFELVDTVAEPSPDARATNDRRKRLMSETPTFGRYAEIPYDQM